MIRSTARTILKVGTKALLTSGLLLVSLPVANAAGRLTDFQCLVEAIYYEIGFGSMEERLAVGAVIMNRVNYSKTRTTICAVVHASSTNKDGRKTCAFSFIAQCPRPTQTYAMPTSSRCASTRLWVQLKERFRQGCRWLYRFTTIASYPTGQTSLGLYERLVLIFSTRQRNERLH